MLAVVDPATELGWQISWWGVVTAVTYLLALLSLPSVLLQREGRPQSALSWLLLFFLLPIVGLFCWWAFGRRHLARRRGRKRRAAETVSQRMTELQSRMPELPEADWPLMPIERLPPDDAVWLSAPTHGNRVELLVNADAAYPAIERAIKSAQKHLHAIYYIWQRDKAGRRFRDLLVERARSGVQVRLLLDAVGSSKSRTRFMNPLRDAGGEVATFMKPVWFTRRLELNFRNHRKLLIADGREAILGGLNIGDEYLSRWRDTAVRLIGPVVDQTQEVFADDWYFSTNDDFAQTEHFGGWRPEIESNVNDPGSICGLVASGPHTRLNFTHEAFFLAINNARHRILITTPYFVPDQIIMAALRSAAFRGVDVEILVPERGDHWLVDLASRSYYPDMLDNGVRFFQYGNGLLHAKTAVFDDDLAVVGSANMDIRSFRLNFELNCFVRSPQIAGELADVFDADKAHAREVTLDDVAQKSYAARLAESAAHLLSPLL